MGCGLLRPLSSSHLTTLLHERGLNMRLLLPLLHAPGVVCVPRLRGLLATEMVGRAMKLCVRGAMRGLVWQELPSARSLLGTKVGPHVCAVCVPFV
jgi:hypothetical protein